MNPATLRVPRNSKRVPSSTSSVTSPTRLDAQKQALLLCAADDLPRRWERIVQQEGHA